MNIFYKLVIGFIFLMLGGCINAPVKSDFSTLDMPETLRDRSRLIKILSASEVLNKSRSLTHLSHTCNLIINNREYPVINIRELVKGAMVPRGVNRIIVLNNGYQLVKDIEYANATPLFCEENKLYLNGDLIVDGFPEKGNVLQFVDDGYEVILLEENLNEKLPL